MAISTLSASAFIDTANCDLCVCVCIVFSFSYVCLFTHKSEEWQKKRRNSSKVCIDGLERVDAPAKIKEKPLRCCTCVLCCNVDLASWCAIFTPFDPIYCHCDVRTSSEHT